MANILTEVITSIANERIQQTNRFGMSIVNLPEIYIQYFVENIIIRSRVELFFLGYGKEKNKEIEDTIKFKDGINMFFTVEEAEDSRNAGKDDVFRIHFIKNSELEKISSLKWYEPINVDLVYKRCCKYAQKKLAGSNETIKALLQVLGRQDIRAILNFERVLEYLNSLLDTAASDLPTEVEQQIYRLGLLMNPGFCTGNQGFDKIKDSIKQNYDTVRRISTLEKKDRQNIAVYSSKNPDNETVRLILEYYSTPSIALLKKMALSNVQECLKAVANSGKTPLKKKKTGNNPVSAAASLMFEEKDELLEKFVEEAANRIDNRTDKNKVVPVPVEIDGFQIDFTVVPTTEKLAEMSVEEEKWGEYIFANVGSPQNAIDDSEKYEQTNFDSTYVDEIRRYLLRASEFEEAKATAESISLAFEKFLELRKKILPYSTRLQDMPMLQVLKESKLFVDYLESYERLIFAIKDGYTSLSELDSIGAKEVVSEIVSLDFVYVIGRDNSHAMPTPLNPLYLWKYIKLAQEIIESRGISEGNEGFISEEDQLFILRKAEEIPDPLALVMLPKNSETTIECLPYAGKIGNIPIYSSTPQISDNKSGMDAVCQNMVRYMCLYPHSSMMLHVSFINPPSVESVVTMLKSLDKNKDFLSFGQVGIDLTIYRTKETSAEWIEIQDKALNEGMLGKVKGKNSERFYLSVKDKCMSYAEIIEDISKEQHMVVIFDPNERNIETAKNNRNIHLHPLCVPKVYEYNKMRGEVKVRPSNEGGIFSNYAAIIEKLYDQPSAFGHRNVFVNTPLRRETYIKLLDKSDWLIILDQNLKSWDISLQSASERLYFKNDDYRAIGVYSKNSSKFSMGYREIITSLGNYSPNDRGIERIVLETRTINDDGLLSIISHSTNHIFEQNHGKGSLGLALAALKYKRKQPYTVLVGLDTQLAQQWLSERDDGKLPDLIGISFDEKKDSRAKIDLIEVKTYDDYHIDENQVISGHAVEQAGILESLMKEIFGKSEKITTVSRREILREQVFEYVFASNFSNNVDKQKMCEMLNKLFAGECQIDMSRNIYRVNFECIDSNEGSYIDENGTDYCLTVIGAKEIQSILTDTDFAEDNSNTIEEGNSLSEFNVVSEAESSCEHVHEETIARSSEKIHHEKVSKESISDSESDNNGGTERMDDNDLHEKCVRLNVVLKSYGINAKPVAEELVQTTNRFTRFKIELKPGETEANLTKRKDDIARELEAAGEIFITRINGTRYIAIDVPFSGKREPLKLLNHMQLLNDTMGSLNFIAGQEPDGNFRIIDLEEAPHMLVAGTTGSGKSVFLNSVIVSLAETHTHDELEMILVDPKQMEFYFYEGLPHLRNDKILTDPVEAIEMLERVRTVDVPERIAKIQSSRSKNILQHNEKCPDDKLKHLVIVIDEYSALVNAASLQGKKIRDEFEKNLCTLVFMARAYGIHLIVATQYPTATYVTSALKSNLPFRVAFRLPSHTDSMTILDRTGAEDLLGNGDMLMLSDEGLTRLQGCFISEDEIIEFVNSKK